MDASNEICNFVTGLNVGMENNVIPKGSPLKKSNQSVVTRIEWSLK